MKSIREKYRKLPVQIKASIWFLVAAFFQKGISVISTPIFTRLLSTSQYGQYEVFNSWQGVITIVVSMNLFYGVYTSGLVKFDSERAAFSSSFQGLNLTLTILWSIVYILDKSLWNKITTLSTFQMCMMFISIWSTSAFYFWAGEQRTEYRYTKLVFMTLLVSFAKPVLGILLVLNANDKVTARILGNTIVELVFYFWCFLAQMCKGKKFFIKKNWKYALYFNIPLIPHYLSQTVLNSADRIMINKMVGSSEAGIYGLAYSISQVMSLFNTALLQTISPWMYQRMKERKPEDISKILFPSLSVVALANLTLICFAPEIVSIFAPKEYYSAIWIIPPVAMSVYFIFCYSLFANFEFYYEKRIFIMIASVIGATLNIILNYIFINAYGYIAAGYTTLACYMIYAIGHYFFMRKICWDEYGKKDIYDTHKLILITTVFLLCGLLMQLLYTHRIFRYAIFLLIFITLLKKRKMIFETAHINISMFTRSE